MKFKRLVHVWLLLAAFASAALPPQAIAASDYSQTKYPIVLVHGLFGTDKVGPFEYWYGIPEDLRANGATVFVAQVSAANTTEVRGEQLLTYVKQVLAITGAKKVNLMGHSHGGPTARYVASVAPDLIASVSSIAGVNQGAAAADILSQALPTSSVQLTVVSGLFNVFSTLIDTFSGEPFLPQNSAGALASLSTAGTAKFNAAHPEGLPTTPCGQGPELVRGVRYFSWGGAQPGTNILDPLDALFVLASTAYGSVPNDGLVSTCSSHLGTVIRDNYALNHFDMVNQVLGLVNVFEISPVALIRQQANRLKNLGL